MSIHLDRIPALDRVTDGRIFQNNIALRMHFVMPTRDINDSHNIFRKRDIIFPNLKFSS